MSRPGNSQGRRWYPEGIQYTQPTMHGGYGAMTHYHGAAPHTSPTFEQYATHDDEYYYTRELSDGAMGYENQDMVRTWSGPGQDMVRTWSGHGQSLVRAWSELGQSLVRAWSEHGQVWSDLQ
ncbi:hypothetical protein M422DRAFT_261614 [Sphaerobolus stellatus SS14]|uniref:Uncharacterized protein n=1 Tax=Sphaerobolus stellatus (strain SS14) TaxID=990650 RepID=A0A0C9VF77_SPHS4|nr:hypothetical protein M422DRAFT_261614 [Sphaerobolus stellatus SS14]